MPSSTTTALSSTAKQIRTLAFTNSHISFLCTRLLASLRKKIRNYVFTHTHSHPRPFLFLFYSKFYFGFENTESKKKNERKKNTWSPYELRHWALYVYLFCRSDLLCMFCFGKRAFTKHFKIKHLFGEKKKHFSKAKQRLRNVYISAKHTQTHT